MVVCMLTAYIQLVPHGAPLSAAQLLQLLRILWSGSAEGLSLVSVLMQLYAFSCPVAYAVANNFPLLYVTC